MTLSSLKVATSIALCLGLSACIQSKCDSDADAGSPDACDSLQEGDTDTDADSDSDTDSDTDSDSDTNATRFDTAVEQGLRPESHFKAKPDFALLDYNPTSTTSEQAVSPRDYLQKVSGWYFAHAT